MKNQNKIQVRAPGKLILSGEHAVLYGKPALAMAIDRYATATITQNTLPDIAFHLADLAHRSRLSIQRLHHLKERIKRKYQRFVRGEIDVRRVLQKPFELAQFAFSLMSDVRPLALSDGANISIQSNIPIGCGMGSSAATILGVMYAVSQYLELSLSTDTLFQLALIAEKMQHGESSGLDLQVMIQGGCVYMHDRLIETRVAPTLPLYLVHTGTPAVSTGECVTAVKKHFQSNQLANDFESVTRAMDAALQENALTKMKENISLNHRLLTAIDVVPDKVQRFIRTIEGE